MDQGVSSPRRPWLRRLAWLLAAWLAASAWGSVVQTHWNLQALAGLGVELPWALRLQTLAQDLAGFGPVYAGIVAAAWLPALAAAAWLARRWPAGRVAWFALAAGVGLVVAIRAVDAVAPMPHFIDATRSLAGLLAMAAGAALAGAWYGHRSRALRPR
jgi:predicted membrane-bound spermidine synthase